MAAPLMQIETLIDEEGKVVDDPMVLSLGRSLQVMNATAFFIESMHSAVGHSHPDAILQMCIAIFAENIRVITAANATQTRADVLQLAERLGITLHNMPGRPDGRLVH